MDLDLSSLFTLSVVKNNLLTQILLPKKASKYCESIEYFCEWEVFRASHSLLKRPFMLGV